jgi:hypothetical protein
MPFLKQSKRQIHGAHDSFPAGAGGKRFFRLRARHLKIKRTLVHERSEQVRWNFAQPGKHDARAKMCAY